MNSIAPSNAKSVKTHFVFPSPENDEIYGVIDKSDNEIIDLSNDIARNGILEPIVVTRDCYIVSGHRRWTAAKIACLTHIPVIELDLCRRNLPAHEYKQLIIRYNQQRHKTPSQRIKEKLVNVDPDIAHQQLIEARESRDRNAPVELDIPGCKVRKEISDAKRPMLKAVQNVIDSLQDYWPLTVRQIHYQLLNDPPLRHNSKPDSSYQNDRKSYQDLVDLIARARLSGDVSFDCIADETRPVSGTRFERDVATFVDGELYHLFRGYRRDLMQSQLDHFELVVEKLTLQNIVKPVANKYCVPLTIGKGYCSLEPRRQIVGRYQRSAKDRLVLLVASDFDPDGDEICASFGRSIRDDFGIDQLVVHKILLTDKQVRQWRLPPNGMEAKSSSSNYAKFIERYGSDQVFELEAVNPQLMQQTVSEAIESVIDLKAFNAELAAEKQDAKLLSTLKSAIVAAAGELGGVDD